MSDRQDIRRQVGVLPFRRRADGLEVLLVTSSTRKRWIIPKGNLEPDLDDLESARREAYEEAGVQGAVDDDVFGTYVHESSGGPTRVDVYLMKVERVLDTWPEASERLRRWMPIGEAHDRILEHGLKELLHAFASQKAA